MRAPPLTKRNVLHTPSSWYRAHLPWYRAHIPSSTVFSGAKCDELVTVFLNGVVTSDQTFLSVRSRAKVRSIRKKEQRSPTPTHRNPLRTRA